MEVLGQMCLLHVSVPRQAGPKQAVHDSLSNRIWLAGQPIGCACWLSLGRPINSQLDSVCLGEVYMVDGAIQDATNHFVQYRSSYIEVPDVHWT